MRVLKVLLPLFVFATVFTTFSLAAQQDRVASDLASGPLVALPGQVHRMAQVKYDLGRLSSSQKLTYITLQAVPTSEQKQALLKLVEEQRDPHSRNYRKWLTPRQAADRFGLSTNDVANLTKWLTSRGFSIVKVANARNFVVFSGTVSQVEAAFQTEMHRYNVNGELHFANATPLSIPASLKGIAGGFHGLHDFGPKARAIKKLSSASTKGKIHSDFFDNHFNLPNFLAPGDLATMYDVTPLYDAGFDGTGQKLAVIGRTDIYLADLVNFRAGFGLPAITGCTANSSGVLNSCTGSGNFQYVVVGTDSLHPNTNGDVGEADLDLEWSNAIARNAQIIYVNGQTADGIFDAYNDAIDNQRAPVISMSYGLCEFFDNTLPTDDNEFILANTFGITFLNSSGDAGAAGCDGSVNPSTDNIAVGGLAVSYPASSPSVTGVGGTAVSYPAGYDSSFWGTTNAADGGTLLAYPPETAWNDDVELVSVAGNNQLFWQQNYAIVSTGGGPSNCATQTSDFSSCVAGFPQPDWQTVTVPNQTAVRFVPDVSLQGSPNFPGYIFCTPLSEVGGSGTTSSCANGIEAALDSQTPSIIGGTSASTPVFAGMVVLLNQALFGDETPGLGNINPALYEMAHTPANGVFHPVTNGTNIVYCQAGTPSDLPESYQCPGTTGIQTMGYDASNADEETGYNLVTGLGSVDLNNMAAVMASSGEATFTFSPNANSVSVVQGQSATVNFNITPINGFTGTLDFSSSSCTGLPSEATCSFSPPSVTLNGSDPASVTLTIKTTAPTAELKMPLNQGKPIFYALLMPGLLGLSLFASAGKRARRWQLLALIVILCLSTLWLSGCGGSNNSSNKDPGTPVGSSSISVTATSNGITRIVKIQVGVTAD